MGELRDHQKLEKFTRLNFPAIANGDLDAEITPVDIVSRKGTTTVAVDEQPGQARIDKIPQLRAAFKKDGTITAANASSISDGASALVLASSEAIAQQGLTPTARIMGVQSFAREPSEFTIAPIGAIEGLLTKLDWQVADVDLFEINEAFAAQALCTMKAWEDKDFCQQKM